MGLTGQLIPLFGRRGIGTDRDPREIPMQRDSIGQLRVLAFMLLAVTVAVVQAPLAQGRG